MRKVILADDEIVIRNGLQKLIKWEEQNLELIGMAEDGHRLMEMIQTYHPDLVISDIQMPGITGLEVLKSLSKKQREEIKFIFISGYEKFSYAREALALGAVDYLLKPVSRSALEEAISKAASQLEQHSVAGVFAEEDHAFVQVFETINEGLVYDKTMVSRIFSDINMNIEGKFLVGICIRLIPTTGNGGTGAPTWNLQKFLLFNHLIKLFQNEQQGFLLRREEDRIHIIGVFPKEDSHNFYEKYIHPKRMDVEQKYNINLQIGMGMRTEDVSGLKNIYKTANFASDLFFFEEKAVIDIETINKDYTVSFDDYQEGVDDLFHSIIVKDGNVLQNIDKLMEMIRQIHYGNVYAAKARVMHFTGDIGMKLSNYKLLEQDFYRMQDALQEKVEAQNTFRDMHNCIMNHYELLTAEIYRTEKSKGSHMIENVKKYIQQHYAEDLSVKTLSDVACVSENYFSAMFKKETGENYKTYLTGIRMEKALELLLNTDMKTYEISEQVGYNNVRRFVDSFKQIYGMSPADYKKMRQ